VSVVVVSNAPESNGRRAANEFERGRQLKV
jgi:hypothetical protein